jgi:hypothetical protein
VSQPCWHGGYSYDKPLEEVRSLPDASAVALNGAVGAEFFDRARVRLEARIAVILANPYLQEGAANQGPYGSATQYELQVRASVRVPLRK